MLPFGTLGILLVIVQLNLCQHLSVQQPVFDSSSVYSFYSAPFQRSVEPQNLLNTQYHHKLLNLQNPQRAQNAVNTFPQPVFDPFSYGFARRSDIISVPASSAHHVAAPASHNAGTYLQFSSFEIKISPIH